MQRAISGKELEVVTAGWDGSHFETFCNALLLAEAPTPLTTFPRLSDRSNVADGGIDALFEFEGNEDTRLLTPGRNVFQFKWRSPYHRTLSFNSILKAVPQELAKQNPPPANYTLVTNLDLSGKQQAALLGELQKLPGSKVSVLAAGGLAALLNNHPLLMAAFRPDETEPWEHRLQAHARLTEGLPEFTGRTRELAQIQEFLAHPEARLLLVRGPAGVGKTRLVLEALAAHKARTIYLQPEPGPQSLRPLAEESLTLVIDSLDHSEELDRWIRAALGVLTKARMIVVTRTPGPSPKDSRLREIPLAPLDRKESSQLLDALETSLTWQQRGWVLDQSSGFPLPLVQSSRLNSGDLESTRSLSQNLARAWQADVCKSLGESAWNALQLASLMVAVSAKPDDGELEAMATVLGIPTGGLGASLPHLEAMGCLERVGSRLLRVRPNFLAEVLCEKLLGNGQNLLLALLGGLEKASAQNRFLERILTLPTEGGSLLRQALMAPDGPWAVPQSSKWIRLAEMEPQAVLDRLQHCETAPEVVCIQRLLSFPKTAAQALRILQRWALRDHEQSDPEQSLTQLFLIQFHAEWPSALTLEEKFTALKSIKDSDLFWKAATAVFYVSDLIVYDYPWQSSPPRLPVHSLSDIEFYQLRVSTLALDRASSGPVPTVLHFLREAADLLNPGMALDSIKNLAKNVQPKHLNLLKVTLECFEKAYPNESGFSRLRQSLAADPRVLLDQCLNYENLECEGAEEWHQRRDSAFATIAQAFGQAPDLLTPDLADRLAADYEGKLFLEHLGREAPHLLSQIPVKGLAPFLASADPETLKGILQHWTGQLDSAYLEILARCPSDDWSRSRLLELASAPEVNIQALRKAGFWRWPLDPVPWLEIVKDHPKLAGWLLEWLGAKQETQFTEPHFQKLGWQCLASHPTPWLANSLRKIQAQMVAAQLIPYDPERGVEIFIHGLRNTRRRDGKLPVEGIVAGPYFQALMKNTPELFLEMLFELVGEVKFSMVHFAQELRENLPPEQQTFLIHYARTHPNQASAVAYCLDSTNPDFWQACQVLLELAPTDPQLESTLFDALTRRGESHWGEQTDRIRGFLAQIEGPLENHPSQPVRRWLSQVKRVLDDDLHRKLVWEYDLKSREFEQSLAASGTPAQKWAVKRLVENAQFQDVRRLLSPYIVAQYLPDLDLPPQRKRALETWIKNAG